MIIKQLNMKISQCNVARSVYLLKPCKNEKKKIVNETGWVRRDGGRPSCTPTISLEKNRKSYIIVFAFFIKLESSCFLAIRHIFVFSIIVLSHGWLQARI